MRFLHRSSAVAHCEAASGTFRRLPPSRCSYDLFVSAYGTRRTACRIRVRNSTALDSRMSSVVPHPLNLERSFGRLRSIAPKREGIV